MILRPIHEDDLQALVDERLHPARAPKSRPISPPTLKLGHGSSACATWAAICVMPSRP